MSSFAPILAIGLTALTVSAQPRIPVTVVSAAREELARRLATTVIKELRRDPRFLFVEGLQPGSLTISLPAGVGWERRLDWTEVHYQARLTFPRGQSRVVAGRCYNWNMSVCARQILDAAAETSAN